LPVVTQPSPTPRTGFPNERCYASCLYDCGRTISGEHYLSRSILRIVKRTRGALYVGGGASPSLFTDRPTSPNKAGANVLCSRHNSALGPLDELAGRLFLAFTALDSVDKLTESRVALFNGHDIERWLIKALCGFLASGEASPLYGRPPRWCAPMPWLDVMYGTATLPEGCGLYINNQIGLTVGAQSGIAITALSSDDGRVAGLEAVLQGVRLVLSLVPSDHVAARLLDGFKYRPNVMQAVSRAGEVSASVLIAWKNRANQLCNICVGSFSPPDEQCLMV